MKFFHTNACSTGNMQEESEAMVQLGNCDLIAIMEMWWDKSHKWNTAIVGYKLVRRDRQGSRSRGVAPYVKWIDGEALPLRKMW